MNEMSERALVPLGTKPLTRHPLPSIGPDSAQMVTSAVLNTSLQATIWWHGYARPRVRNLARSKEIDSRMKVQGLPQSSSRKPIKPHQPTSQPMINHTADVVNGGVTDDLSLGW